MCAARAFGVSGLALLLALNPALVSGALGSSVLEEGTLDSGASLGEREWVPILHAAPGDTTAAGDERAFFLDSYPGGAAVYWADERLGATPLWLRFSTSRAGSLVVSLPGYRSERIDLGAIEGYVVEVRLQSERAALEGLGRSARAKGPSLGVAPSLKWSLAVLGVGSAALGLHFKGRADDVYDEYLRTGHAGRMRERFDRAETYDRYALGCWVVAEASLVGFLYLLTRRASAEDWKVEVGSAGVGEGCILKVGRRFP